MLKRIYILPIAFTVIGLSVGGSIFYFSQKAPSYINPSSFSVMQMPSTVPTDKQPTPTPYMISVPKRKVLLNEYHVFQSFNNCGPAALSMALSYYGITKSQKELGEQLRPYQNPQGNNDDKSVTLEELANKADEYNLTAYHRPNGTKESIKQFIALDIPVITRTLLHTTDDIGHFRIIKGYDENQQVFIQDDSLQGKNLSYSYEEFDQLWKQFGYEYVVLVPQDKKQFVENILGENRDEKRSWEIATSTAEKQTQEDPLDIYAELNLSGAAYHTGD